MGVCGVINPPKGFVKKLTKPLSPGRTLDFLKKILYNYYRKMKKEKNL